MGKQRRNGEIGNDKSESEESGYQYEFFLAYANADYLAASILYDLLEPYSRVFLDKRVLQPGSEWSVMIPNAQRRSRVTVVLVSSNSDNAYYQREEIAMAVQLARNEKAKHLVVPVLLDEMRPPEDVLPYGLMGRQTVYCFGEDPFPAVAQELLDVLKPWWPHPERDKFFETQSGDRVWRTGPPLSIQESRVMLGKLSQSTEKMVQVANQLASMLEGLITSGVRILEFLKNRQERAHLKLLLRQIGNLYAMQDPFPELIRRYCREPHPLEWDYILADAAVLADNVAELSTLLSTEDGDFSINCHDVHLTLMMGLTGRQQIYRQLRRLDAPTDQHSLTLLLSLAENYDSLILSLERADAALIEYIKHGGMIADHCSS